MPQDHSAVAIPRQTFATAAVAGLLLCSSGASWANTDTMGQWREYARRGMMPEYSLSDSTPAQAPTVLKSLRREQLARASLVSALDSPLSSLSFEYSTAPSGLTPESAPVGRLLAGERSAIQSEFIGSTFGHDFAGRARLELSAVVAHQRYASPGLGTTTWLGEQDYSGGGTQEFSSGHGVRLNYARALGAEWAWNVSVQSRLDMDAFESYRGIYAEAGDFDLPARLRTGLQWNATSDVTLGFGIERVFYSEIPAFTSAALPTRFLSLLGDGNSPEFAWRDLTVYSIEGALSDRTGAQWSLRYSTRQQPSPTSRLLERAMQSEFTDTNIALGYRRGFGPLGQLALAASYAPSHYFLGATPYALRDFDGGSQVEFEALWSLPF
jgi:hypothetical protein